MSLFKWFSRSNKLTEIKQERICPVDEERARFEAVIKLMCLLNKLGVRTKGVTPSLVLGMARGVTYKTRRRLERQSQEKKTTLG